MVQSGSQLAMLTWQAVHHYLSSRVRLTRKTVLRGLIRPGKQGTLGLQWRPQAGHMLVQVWGRKEAVFSRLPQRHGLAHTPVACKTSEEVKADSLQHARLASSCNVASGLRDALGRCQPVLEQGRAVAPRL